METTFILFLAGGGEALFLTGRGHQKPSELTRLTDAAKKSFESPSKDISKVETISVLFVMSKLSSLYRSVKITLKKRKKHEACPTLIPFSVGSY